jgi:hypothetical protein
VLKIDVPGDLLGTGLENALEARGFRKVRVVHIVEGDGHLEVYGLTAEGEEIGKRDKAVVEQVAASYVPPVIPEAVVIDPETVAEMVALHAKGNARSRAETDTLVDFLASAVLGGDAVRTALRPRPTPSIFEEPPDADND